MRRFILFISLSLVALASQAQISKMLGYWDTIDDKTNQRKGKVELYQADNGKYYGKIVALYEIRDGKCYVVKEYTKEQKEVIGMLILKDLVVDGDVLKGQCYDPESKKTYYGKISYDAAKDRITLRGSLDKLGVLGRSQTWLRSK